MIGVSVEDVLKKMRMYLSGDAGEHSMRIVASILFDVLYTEDLVLLRAHDLVVERAVLGRGLDATGQGGVDVDVLDAVAVHVGDGDGDGRGADDLAGDPADALGAEDGVGLVVGGVLLVLEGEGVSESWEDDGGLASETEEECP